jgi:hypothetical protein
VRVRSVKRDKLRGGRLAFIDKMQAVRTYATWTELAAGEVSLGPFAPSSLANSDFKVVRRTGNFTANVGYRTASSRPTPPSAKTAIRLETVGRLTVHGAFATSCVHLDKYVEKN